MANSLWKDDIGAAIESGLRIGTHCTPDEVHEERLSFGVWRRLRPASGTFAERVTPDDERKNRTLAL
jgi:hypothetical protein